ncbi:MAG: CARDB domain-containing protein, partial [Candidatus Thermoplasmatota archaeon]|nr:CARDB domain-containing protein [Candidatus Thermoplasmatota archaeon]
FAAPTTPTATVEVALPFVDVTAVTPEIAEGVVNSSVSGMVTVANTGQATASAVSVWCYEGEELADTTQITVSLAPGEEKDVPFTWYAYTAGEAALTCKPLLPTALNEITEDVVDLTGATSPSVMWEYAEEVEEAPIIIYTAMAIGFVALALFVASQTRRNEKDYATYTEDEVWITHEHVEAGEEGEDDDDVPVADDSAEEASDAEDAEDEEPEGLDEEDSDENAEKESTSVYDFQESDA